MENKNNLPYRKCAGMMIFNNDMQVFVAKRIDTKAESWQMPQGGIDDGESCEEAAIREVEEEIGTANIEIIRECEEWFSYDLPDELIGEIWGGKYRGQTQKWFAMKFLGNDSEINIETKHPEFSEWKWLNPQELPSIIVPFKKELYKRLVNEFKDIWKCK